MSDSTLPVRVGTASSGLVAARLKRLQRPALHAKEAPTRWQDREQAPSVVRGSTLPVRMDTASIAPVAVRLRKP